MLALIFPFLTVIGALSTETIDDANAISFGAGYTAVDGNFVDTRIDDDVFFAVYRSNSGGSSDNLEAYLNLTYDISSLGTDPANISLMRFGIRYCHSKDDSLPVTCSSLSGGTFSAMDVEVYNFTDGSYLSLGTLALADGTETYAEHNVTSGFADIVNQSLIYIRYPVNISLPANADAAMAIDYATLTVSYDSGLPPSVNVTSPVNNTGVFGTAVNLSAWTEDYATCEHSENQSFVYGTGSRFNVTGSQNHTANLTGLSSGYHTFYVKCNSTFGYVHNDSNQGAVTIQMLDSPLIYRTYPSPIGKDDPIYFGVVVVNPNANYTLNITRVDIDGGSAGDVNLFNAVTSSSGDPADPTVISTADCPSKVCVVRWDGNWSLAGGAGMEFLAEVDVKAVESDVIVRSLVTVESTIFQGSNHTVHWSNDDAGSAQLGFVEQSYPVLNLSLNATEEKGFTVQVTNRDTNRMVNPGCYLNVSIPAGWTGVVANSTDFTIINVVGNATAGWLISAENYTPINENSDNRTLSFNATAPMSTVDNHSVFNTTFANCTEENGDTVDSLMEGVVHISGIPDVIPPSTVSGLENISQSMTWIYWNWTNPPESDFNSSIVFLDGVWQLNTSSSFYNATGLAPSENHTLTIQTKDHTGNVNSTNVSINASTLPDTLLPTIIFSAGTDGTGLFRNRDWIFVNVTASDQFETNITFYLYNSTSQVNASTLGLGNRSINFTTLLDGPYFYNVTIRDIGGNENSTETRNLTLDTIIPSVSYSVDTESDAVHRSQNWIYVNITASDTNEANITFYLFNSTAQVNASTLGASSRNINFTALPDEVYSYNVTVLDLADNANLSATRTITLDTLLPAVYDLQSGDVDNVTRSDASLNLTVTVNDTNIANVTLNGTLMQQSGSTWWTVNTSAELGCTVSGSCLLTATATDLANNQNLTGYTFTVDDISPALAYSVDTESNGTYRSQNWIYVNITASDTNEANITFYLFNSTAQVNASTLGAGNRSINFTALPDDIYSYNVTVLDLADNANLSVTRTLTLDTLAPTMTFSADTESDGVYRGQNWIYVNITASDTNEGNLIFYLYNSTAQVNSSILGPGNRSINFTALPDEVYSYNVTVLDLADNSNLSATRTITLDTTTPSIAYSGGTEAEGVFVKRNWIYVNVTASDTNEGNLTFYLFNSSLHNQSRVVLGQGNRTTNFTTLSDGIYFYNVTITDLVNLSNTTSIRNITLDTTPPSVLVVSLTPNSTDDVDPTVFLNFTVNVTDAVGVATVVLQYKQSGAGTFSDSPAYLDGSTGLYVANFTPNIADMWNYRFLVNDTLGNANLTDQVNLSVDYERSWTRSPAMFEAVACPISTTCPLGNLTINNTGDYTLNFDLSSTFGDTSYNVSEPFDLAAKEAKAIEVSVDAGTTQAEFSVVLTIDATTAEADPDQSTTNTTLAVFTGGPYFNLEITDAPITVNRSIGGPFNFSATLKNIGNETSQNTTFTWSLPAGWTNVSGGLIQNMGNLTPSSTLTSNLSVNLSTSAETGVQTVQLTAAGDPAANDTDSASVVVLGPSVTIVVQGGGGGGGVAGGGGIVEVPILQSVVETEAIYELVRGRDIEFTLPVTNNFTSPMQNFTARVVGFLAQYIELRDVPSEISPKSAINMTVFITAPRYFNKGEWRLNFTLEAAVDEITLSGAKRTIQFREERAVLLQVHELSRSEAKLLIVEIAEAIADLEKKGLGTRKLRVALTESERLLEQTDYEGVAALHASVMETVDGALQASTIIEDFRLRVRDAKEEGVSTPETTRLIALAESALSREDYETAVTRLREIELTYALEVKGVFSIAQALKDHKIFFFVILAWIPVFVVSIVRANSLRRLTSQLRSLANEQEVIDGLLATAQRECFEAKTMDLAQYNSLKEQYETRKNNVVQSSIELESTRDSMLHPSLDPLSLERDRLLDLIKRTQDRYIVKRDFDATTYKSKLQSYSSRLSEVEGRVIIRQAKWTIRKERVKRWIPSSLLKWNYRPGSKGKVAGKNPEIRENTQSPGESDQDGGGSR